MWLSAQISTITYSGLLTKGLEGFSPSGVLAGYNVTGVRGVSSVELRDIRAKPGSSDWQANAGTVKIAGLTFTVSAAQIGNDKKSMSINGFLRLPPPLVADAFGTEISEAAGFVINEAGVIGFAGGKFAIPRGFINYVDIFLADCGFEVTSGPRFSGFGRGKLQIPSFVPIAGGFTFASAEAGFSNDGFHGSVTINVTPEVPSVCTPAFCLPGGCVGYPCGWDWCAKCWSGPCFPQVCTPRIPAISASVGFRFSRGKFSFAAQSEPDLTVESWELFYQHRIIDPETGNEFSFMSNWSRGRTSIRLAPADGLLPNWQPRTGMGRW